MQNVDAAPTVCAEDLLPVMYHELRSLARARLQGSHASHTLQPTALVHEAYLRLSRGDPNSQWNGPAHFFGAAAEAMRQILIDHARAKFALKRGGGRTRVELSASIEPSSMDSADQAERTLFLNDVITRLQNEDPLLATILKLRCFAGLSREETAAACDLAPRTFDRRWRYIAAIMKQMQAHASDPVQDSPATAHDHAAQPSEPC